MATKLGPSGSIKKKPVGAAKKAAYGTSLTRSTENRWLSYVSALADIRDKLRLLRDAFKK